MSSLCGPQGTRRGSPKAWEARERLKTSAAHRSAAMAGGARPDPFRTRKLSRRAPMVLRGQPVGEQGAADRWTALDPHIAGSGAGAPRGIPPRRPLLSLPVCVRRAPRGLDPGAWLPSFPHIVQPRAPRGPFFMGGILPCLQIDAEEPCALPAPRLFCFAADPPGPPAGGPFGTRPLSSAIGPLSRPLGPRAFSLVQGGGT